MLGSRVDRMDNMTYRPAIYSEVFDIRIIDEILHYGKIHADEREQCREIGSGIETDGSAAAIRRPKRTIQALANWKVRQAICSLSADQIQGN